MGLGGYSPTPAAASTATTTVKYHQDAAHFGGQNSYWVDATVTVKSEGEWRYTLNGTLSGRCTNVTGPDEWMALDYGSSKESWETLQFRCHNDSSTVTVTGHGSVSEDRAVHLRDCAFGGGKFLFIKAGVWNCGEEKIVHI
ncbi:hypothetical protein [Streptomyces sp. NPDC058989]|uniref:hypothetical protein n=1 Tax=Streptomyces sp. NPDC058989 TaxID=3346686 RepID=UPI00368A2CF1